MNTEEIGKELIEPTFDLGTDYAELALDEFFDDGLLKEVPVVKTLVALVKTGIAIKERFFIKKFLVFLKEFHLDGEDKEELKEFKKKFDEDKKYREKITEQILVIVEQLDSVQKAKISAPV
ncbi:MAG: hypothetical protein HYV68_00615 [Candidatus Taylorbacteria bacterium]|nr:hypothetical protein [Candidatus Taylorbacteria bacterium]